MSAQVQAAFLTEMRRGTMRAKLMTQSLAVVGVLAGLFLDERIRLACGAAAPPTLAAMFALMFLSNARWPRIARAGSAIFVLVETSAFCAEAQALGVGGLVWTVPIVTTIMLAAALFFAHFYDYLLTCLGSWVALFALTDADVLSVFSGQLLAVYIVIVIGVGIIMQRGFAVLVGRLMLARLQFESLANTDELTGLSNRRHFLDGLAAAIEQGEGVLAMLDIDHFKQVNDRHGHAMGDTVIRAIAAHLSRVEHGAACGRLGGEEFAIVLLAPMGEVPRLFQPLQVALQSDVLPVTVSIGVAAILPGRTAGELLAQADLQLYRAKARGRNCICMETPHAAALGTP